MFLDLEEVDGTSLICQVTSCGYVIKGVMICGWQLLTLSHHCTKFDAYRSSGIGDITFCHVISRDHMMEETLQSKSSLCQV